jgi:hypothetical protein
MTFSLLSDEGLYEVERRRAITRVRMMLKKGDTRAEGTIIQWETERKRARVGCGRHGRSRKQARRYVKANRLGQSADLLVREERKGRHVL